jgi:RES domain-containing protein
MTEDEIDRLGIALQRCIQYTMRFEETVYRFTSVERANPIDLISGVGSAKFGQRWNPRGMKACYTSLDEHTALDECLEVHRVAGLHIKNATPIVLAAIDVVLERVLDLTDLEVREILGREGFTAERMIREPWHRRLDSGGSERGLTIEIGRIAGDFWLYGLIVPSKVSPNSKNLVVYPIVRPPSSIVITNLGLLPPPPAPRHPDIP